jgi:hypothetical protein
LIRSQSAEYFRVRFSSLHKHCRTGTPSLILPILAAHHSLFSADFITNIAESSFRHTHPIDSSIDHSSGALRTHNEKPNGGAMPPGYSSRDDRCGIVRVAA